LTAETGANGDHTQTHSEGSVCGQKDVLHTTDQTIAASDSFYTVDPAGGEPASQGDGPADDDVCDSSKPTEVKNSAREDVSTLCADISSGVSHMDIDVSEEVVGDSVITSGISTSLPVSAPNCNISDKMSSSLVS